MKIRETITVAAHALLIGLLSASAHAQEPAKLPDKDVRAIADASQAFARGIVARDLKTLVAFYTSDGVLYPPGETAVRGHASIEACLTALPPMKDFALRITRTDGRDDLAYVQGTYTMTVTVPGAKDAVQDSGYFIEIRRRQADGRWLIAVQMFAPHE
jgi:uncharacterized protein (TIGR02246 family)